MNRLTLARALAKEINISTKEAEKIISSFGAAITGALKKDEKVIYSNFGTFYKVHYPSKIIFHPTLGKKKQMVMLPTDAVKWMPSDNIKDLVNHNLKTETITGFGATKKNHEVKSKAGIPDRKAIELEDEIVEIPIRVTSTKIKEPAPVEDKIATVPPVNQTALLSAKEIEKAEKAPIEIAKSTPANRIISLILKRAIRDGASAILFDPDEKEVLVRFRINSKVFDKSRIKKTIYKNLLLKMKELAGIHNKNATAVQNPFSVSVDGVVEDFEYISLPTAYGDKVMVTITDRVKSLKKLTELDLLDHDFQKIKNSLPRKGLVLVTGQSEKDRTAMIYALADHLEDIGLNIIAIEKHPALVVPKFNQIKIDETTGLGYEKALEFATRFNPDAIFIDDLTSPDLINKALSISSDRIVIAGIKSDNTFDLLVLLDNLGIDRKPISSYLNLIIATKSKAKICRSCRTIVVPDRNTLKRVRDEIGTLPSETRSRLRKLGSHFYTSKGCHFCNHSGYENQIGLHEVMENTDKIKELLVSGADLEKIEKEAVKNGFINLTQDGIIKSLLGETSLEEILDM